MKSLEVSRFGDSFITKLEQSAFYTREFIVDYH